jgi:hypothetical protein
LGEEVESLGKSQHRELASHLKAVCHRGKR